MRFFAGILAVSVAAVACTGATKSASPTALSTTTNSVAVTSGTVTSTPPSSTSTTSPPPVTTVTSGPSIVATVEVPGGRSGVVAAGGGIWVGGQQSDLLVRVDPATNRVTARVQRAEQGTLAINAGLGSLWACGTRNTDQVDPVAATVTATYPVGCAFGITTGFGSVWIAQSRKVVRLDPVTGATTATIAVRGGEWGIAAGAGSVWVADGHSGPGVVSRIDPETNRVIATIAVPVRTRNIVATDTAVWITTEPQWNAPDKTSLVRIDPATNTIAARFTEPSDSIGLDLAGPYLWVVSYGGPVFIVDTRTNAVVHAEKLVPGGVTRGGERLTVANGNIWITAQYPGTLIRVDPGPFGA